MQRSLGRVKDVLSQAGSSDVRGSTDTSIMSIETPQERSIELWNTTFTPLADPGSRPDERPG